MVKEQTSVSQENQNAQQPGQQAPATDAALASAIAALTSALKPAEPAAQESQVTQGDIGSTGDDVLDGMVQSVSLAYPKLSLDRALGNAIESGDQRFIDEAYIRETAGKDAERLLQVAKSMVARVTESATALKNSVYSAVGGEQNWNTAVAAFNKAAPEELKYAVATMLDSGKQKQVTAAAQLVSQFAAAGGFIRSGSNAGAPTFSAPASGQGLSGSDFKAEIAKLDRNARDFQEKRADLYNRRALGRKSGI